MRPCGCQRDPIAFGHDHGTPPAFALRIIWHADIELEPPETGDQP